MRPRQAVPAPTVAESENDDGSKEAQMKTEQVATEHDLKQYQAFNKS